MIRPPPWHPPAPHLLSTVCIVSAGWPDVVQPALVLRCSRPVSQTLGWGCLLTREGGSQECH